MADSIPWERILSQVSGSLPLRNKWPSRNLRLAVGLSMLSGGPLSREEATISKFEENIYWQYFCGFREVQWKCEMAPPLLARWRALLQETGWSSLLELELDKNRHSVPFGTLRGFLDPIAATVPSQGGTCQVQS